MNCIYNEPKISTDEKINIDDRIKKIKNQLNELPTSDTENSVNDFCQNLSISESNKPVSNNVAVSDYPKGELYINLITKDLQNFERKFSKKTLLLAKYYAKDIKSYTKYIYHIEAKLKKYKEENKILKRKLKELEDKHQIDKSNS